MVTHRSKEQMLAFHARLAGYAGLVPLVAPLGVIVWQPEWATVALGVQQAYAALLLSFLGGIYWGVGLDRQQHVAIWLSVLPTLWAWAALSMPPTAATGLLAIGFALMFLIDRVARSRGWIRQWFFRLRLTLGTVAIVSLLPGLAGWFV
ncbi:MAG: DUF3429 domain-containing protein [Halothiobacillaceae bacterium]|nr:DUF3429 domain-containing protein [Halothiobacillaceae bacterium]